MRISDWSSDVCSADLPADPAHLFSAQRIFDVGEPLSRKLERVIDMRLTARRRHEQVPKPGAPGLGLKLLDRLQRLPSIAGRELLRSEEHTSELQSLMRISYAVFCLKKKKKH